MGQWGQVGWWWSAAGLKWPVNVVGLMLLTGLVGARAGESAGLMGTMGQVSRWWRSAGG